MTEHNLQEKSYHFIGIGGIGMSALANIALEKGAKVTGSDRNSSHLTEELKKKGAEISIGHRSEHLKNPSTVIFSTGIHQENPEIQAAKQKQIPSFHRAEFLEQLMHNYHPILVTGTHGKTTTSSLLAHVLVYLELDPSYAIGGIVSSLKSNGRHGKGSYFVAEADESDGSFLKCSAFGAIITNIDREHLNYWNSMEKMVEGFSQFGRDVNSKDHLFWCGDDDRLNQLKLKGFSYGFDTHNALYIKNFVQQGWKCFFDCSFRGTNLVDVEIPLVGAHNVLNAAAVLGMALQLGLKEEEIRKAFLAFRGIGRRVELKGEVKGICILDDYAHHPSEIFATLRALKLAIEKRRLVVVFQPHRYSRTQDCFHDFSTAFENVDLLIITDIYAASEEPIEGVSGLCLAKKLQEELSIEVCYLPRYQLVQELVSKVKEPDVLVTMGAGDITHLGEDLMDLLEAR